MLYYMDNQLHIFNIDSISDIIKNSSRKRIHFKETVSYYYIPSRQEMIEEDIKKDIWWTMEEMQIFRAISNLELQQFMRAYPNNNIRDVQKQLWLVLDFDEIYARFSGINK